MFNDISTDVCCRSEIPKMVNVAMIQSSVVRLEMILQCPYYPQNEFELKWFGCLMTRSGSVSKVSGQSMVSHVSCSTGISCTNWDLDKGDMDTDEDMDVPKAVLNPSDFYQVFSSELRKKFEVRLITLMLHLQ